MLRFLIILAAIWCFSVEASAHQEHREHGAHVHGQGQLALAFDGTQGEIDFHTAAMGIVGFEHPAKSKKDLAAKEKAFAKFEKNISRMVQLDLSLRCHFMKKTMEIKPDEDGDHSDFIAVFTVNCESSPQGHSVTFDFSMWPAMNLVKATVLVGELQKTVDVRKQPITLMLK